MHHEYHSDSPNHLKSHPFLYLIKLFRTLNLLLRPLKINRNLAPGEKSNFHVKFISKFNFQLKRPTALNLGLRAT